jgi:hypothetical protein
VNPYPPGPRGWGLALVDLTWSLPNTVAGLLYLGAHLLAGHRVDPDASVHTGQIHVTERTHEAYVMTIGPVVAGATEEVRAHESVHVFQARVLGPLYLPLVALNYAVFTVAPVWLLYHDHVRWPIRDFATYFTHGVYPHTFHEVWAFRRSQSFARTTS